MKLTKLLIITLVFGLGISAVYVDSANAQTADFWIRYLMQQNAQIDQILQSLPPEARIQGRAAASRSGPVPPFGYPALGSYPGLYPDPNAPFRDYLQRSGRCVWPHC